MRDPKTYRAFRRNEPGNFVRLSGESFKKPFEDNSRYETPSKKERYWANRLKKNRAEDKKKGLEDFEVVCDQVSVVDNG